MRASSPGHHVLAGDVGHLHYVHQFVQLAGGLLNRVLVPRYHEGQAGEALLFAGAHGEAGNVESAAAKQAGHAGEDPGPVLHQRDDSVLGAMLIQFPPP